MRILVSNPDTIGDMVLRQPFYAALLGDGHELMLIVRKSVAPLVPYVAPGVKATVLPVEVYRDDLPMHWGALAETFQTAREFDPDLLVVAPYQWTLFEEKLAEELPGVRRIGMNGRLYRGNPHAGRSPESKLWFDAIVSVTEEQWEIEKNAALAQLVLGKPLQLEWPKLFPTKASLARAEEMLRSASLEPNGFWIAAVAGTRHVHLKQWDLQRWGELLAHSATTLGRRFLFVGLPEERPIIESVRSSMGDRAADGIVLNEQGSGIEQLIALTSLAGGYIGHDTGPMHLAAALGKPAVAVFGGGTWPRFVPAVEPSCAIMVGVPCTGCGWVCGFKRPHCIDDVPAGQVMQAVDDLDSGKIQGRELRVIPAGGTLQEQMIRESAEIVRQQQREMAEVARQLQEPRTADDEQRRLDAERDRHGAEVAAIRQASNGLLAELEARHAQELARLGEDFTVRLNATLDAERARSAKVIDQLATRLGHIEGRLGPRKPPQSANWAVRIARWMAGTSEYTSPTRPLAKISIILPLAPGQDSFRQAIESVVGQSYPDFEFLVVNGRSTNLTPTDLAGFSERIDRVYSDCGAPTIDSIARAFNDATGEVIGYLAPGSLLEPGALLKVAEHFRDKPSVHVIHQADTVTRDGWRFAAGSTDRLAVFHLLNRPQPLIGGLFLRKSAYLAVDGVDPELGRAGIWSMLIRLTRMWGVNRAAGHIVSTIGECGKIGQDLEPSAEESERAAETFLAQFGLPGRIRCRLIQGLNVVRSSVRGAFGRRRFFWPLSVGDKPLPPGEPPAVVPEAPASPLTGRPPDRLLFSTRDTRSGDRRIHYVYHESATGLAMAYPPLERHALRSMFDRQKSDSLTQVIPPDASYASPYQNFRGGGPLARRLSRVPSPWWWFNEISYTDPTVAEIVQTARPWFAAMNPQVRFLDVGCFEGDLLDGLRTQTKWKLHGIESNAGAVEAARSKDYPVWHAAAEDAPVVVPQGVCFDLIFLGRAMEHWDDPLVGLNRLKLLLAPGGAIVISVPNLDSKQVELFGPTWAHWNMPYHRTLLSRRALRRLAAMASMRVERLCTRTHPYWTTMSVQLNRLGLGAVVPLGAEFPKSAAMDGTRLTGWSKLLWDWRGRGDYMIALLRPH